MTAWQILGVWLSGLVVGLALGVVGMMRAPNKSQSYVMLEARETSPESPYEPSNQWRTMMAISVGHTLPVTPLMVGVYVDGYVRLRESEHFSVR